MKATFGFSILLMAIVSTFAYPDAAPEQACLTMTPQHRAFQLNGNSGALTAIKAGSTINVTLSAGAPFKGFIIQGQDEEENIVGLFRPDPNGNYQLMTCNSIEGNSITHINTHPKQTVSAIWEIPQAKGEIIFKATIVYAYESGQKLKIKLGSN